MTFSKIWPLGLSVGSKLGSADLVALDSDHALAADKSTAGDTISGTWTFSGASSGIVVANTSTTGITVQSGAPLKIQGAATVPTGGTVTFTGTGKTVAPDPTSHTFASPLTRTIRVPMLPIGTASGWSTAATAGALVGGASTNAQQVALPRVHNGATLASVKLIISVTGPHSNLPANFPTFNVVRRTLADGGSMSGSAQSLRAAGFQSFSAATAAAWDNSNLLQSQTYTCDQNNVMDDSTYVYLVSIFDENGANAVTGNFYVGLELSFTGVADMRFP